MYAIVRGMARDLQTGVAVMLLPAGRPAPPVVSRWLLQLDRGRESGASVRLAYSILIGGLLLFLAIVFLQAIYSLFDTLVILFLSLIVSQAMHPAVEGMRRWRVPRAVSVLLVYLSVAAILGTISWLVLPPVAIDIWTFLLRLPDLANQLVEFLAPVRDLLARFGLLENVTAGLRALLTGLAQNLASILNVPLLLLQLGVSISAIFVFAFLFSVNGARIEAFLLSFVHPDRRQDTSDVLHAMGARLGRFVRSELLVMTSVGLMTWLGLIILGIPFAHLLALWAFFSEAIPLIGPTLGAIPAVIYALFVSPILAAEVIGLYVVVQMVENYLLVPLIHGRQLRMDPIVVLLSLLVGTTLFGFVGAFLAVPATAALQVLVEDVIVPWRRAQIARDLAARRAEEEQAKKRSGGGGAAGEGRPPADGS